jgi:hypothetical protein
MACAVGGATHLNKEDRHVAVLTIDSPPNNHASLGLLHDLVNTLGLMRRLSDDSGLIRLRHRRRSPWTSKSRPASASGGDFVVSEPGRRWVRT